jgi:hypothetical protein
MASSIDPPTPAAARLDAIAQELNASGQALSPERSQLDPEHIQFVRDTNLKLIQVFQGMRLEPGGWSNLQSRSLRHDLRNHIGIVRGFCDLMLMDIDSSMQDDEQLLTRMIQRCEEFASVLDTVNPEANRDAWPS